MDSIFEIIREYPDSTPTLSDLKTCLQKSGQHRELELAIIATYVLIFHRVSTNMHVFQPTFFLSSFRIRERLLIIDAKTQSVLDMFLSINHCLEFLDLPPASKHNVMQSLKKYLGYVFCLKI